jgi:hypothetical protein
MYFTGFRVILLNNENQKCCNGAKFQHTKIGKTNSFPPGNYKFNKMLISTANKNSKHSSLGCGVWPCGRWPAAAVGGRGRRGHGGGDQPKEKKKMTGTDLPGQL